jgi:cytoskeletal protein CcmA (bactofilin family)
MLLAAGTARAGSREKGSALMAVVGLMGVAAVITITVASVTIGAIGVTTSTRAGVQSQASAEAGIDVTIASLGTGLCPATTSPVGAPAFTVAISYSLSDSGDSWTTGCPGAGARRVKIVSTGTAAAAGVGGNTSGDKRVVEAIYKATSPGITPSGAAIYSFGSTGFGTTGKLLSVNGSQPNVHVKNGDINCGTAGEVHGDVVVANGTFTVGTSCKIFGDVWSSGAAVLGTSFVVGGSITAPSVAMGVSSRVGGDLWSSGTTTLDTSAVVVGNVRASQLALGTSATVQGSAWVLGSAALGTSSTILGHLTAQSVSGVGSTPGGRTLLGSPGPGPAATPAPVVPNWMDFNYAKTDWAGFSETPMSGVCSFGTLQSAVSNFSGPGIIDARGCSNGIELETSKNLTISHDLVIVANRFNFAISSGFSASTDRRLWLISPDTVHDSAPTCPVSGAFDIGTSFSMGSTIAALIYTPCTVTASTSAVLRGQIYSNKVDLSTSTELHYVRIGVPGVDLDTGTAPPAAGALGERSSIRDVRSSG